MPTAPAEIDFLHGCGYRPLKDALKPSESCVPAEVLEANIRSCLERGLRWVTEVLPHEDPAVICAGGPSLADNLVHVKERYWRDQASIFAVNGTVQYLHKNGVKVWGCVLLDPQEILASQIEIVPGVIWFVASQCHPAVFDKLVDEDIFIWHADSEADVRGICHQYRHGFDIIPGGSTAALRTLPLCALMGWRDFHYYGLDGSFSETRHHAYDQPEDDGIPIKVVKIAGDDKAFVTRKDYARQADEFLQMCDQLDRLKGSARVRLQVHGEGLIPHLWRKRRQHERDAGHSKG